MSDGIILLDADGSLSWANGAALAMHGAETLSDLGQTAQSYQKRFHLTDRGGRAVPEEAPPMARLCRGETFDDVVVDVCRSGRPEPDWVHCNRGLVLRHDDGDCLVLVITDATEAFEAEERFESMFNANPRRRLSSGSTIIVMSGSTRGSSSSADGAGTT